MRVIIVSDYQEKYIKKIFVCKTYMGCNRKFDELFYRYADKSGLDSCGDDVQKSREQGFACFEKADVALVIYNNNVEVV